MEQPKMETSSQDGTTSINIRPPIATVSEAPPASPSGSVVELRPHWSPKSLSPLKAGTKPTVAAGEKEEQAPVEREAGQQILKAWQELERKAKKAAQKTPSQREEEEEDEDNLFATLECDEDAVVLSRMAKKNNVKRIEEDSDDEEDDEEDSDNEEGVEVQAAPSVSPAKEPSNRRPLPFKKPSHSDGRDSKPVTPHHSHGTAFSSRRSTLKKKKKKRTHRRANTVEQAMFGLMDDIPLNQTSMHQGRKPKKNLTQVQSSRARPTLQKTPLQATDQLIQTAQKQVQVVQTQKKWQQLKKKQQTTKVHTTLDNQDPTEEEKEQELKDIINEDGDKVGTTEEDGINIALNRIEKVDSDEEDEEEDDDEVDEETGKPNKRRNRHRGSKILKKVQIGVQADWALFQQFLTPRRATWWMYLRVVGLLMVLSLTTAALVFYLKEFPEQKEREQAGIKWYQEDDNPYLSWWFLFIGVRQIITLTLALVTQAILIDYVALGSRLSLTFFGPAVTLLSIQARGWPCVLTLWAIYDLILLSGDRPMAHHWLYWQDAIALFTERNHSGNIVQSDWNFRILITAAVVGVVVAIKRMILGLILARKMLSHFGDEFEDLKKQMILIGELATLAMEIQIAEQTSYLNLPSLLVSEPLKPDHHNVTSMNLETIKKTLTTCNNSERSAASEPVPAPPNAADAANAFVARWKSSETAINNGAPRLISVVNHKGGPEIEPLSFRAGDPGDKIEEQGKVQGLQNEWADDDEVAEQAEIDELLNEWDDAEDRLERKQERDITLGSILKFYKEITVMNRRYPFLPVFGRADTRDKCINSAQRLFDRLMLRTPTVKKLPFSTIALLAKDEGDDRMDKTKLRELIRTFRPDRDGKLSKLDFVKIIDTVWRDLRKLNLNIEDSVQIDKELGVLVDIVFYFVVGSIVLEVFGFHPLQLFISLSSLIIGFTFVFASSSAKWFEGMLFIVAQRPYGVGDRIHLSNPASETNANGSSGWIVEKVSLNTTTVYWGSTNERATLSNGAIADLRVINAARSPKASVKVYMKFGMDTPYKKIQIFRIAAEQYMKRRPREWSAFLGFFPLEVVIDRGYIEYMIIGQHRESWQKVGAIFGSKANLTTYLLEVSKQLDMRYISPPLPVDLKLQDASAALLAAGVKRQDLLAREQEMKREVLGREPSKRSVGTFF